MKALSVDGLLTTWNTGLVTGSFFHEGNYELHIHQTYVLFGKKTIRKKPCFL